MNEFFKIVKERPDPSLSLDHITCPFCDSDDVKQIDHVTTLVGGFGDEDPNHHWRNHICKDCHKPFIVEHKKGNIWYTPGRHHGKSCEPKVLRGIPSCFETYIYTCSKCGGDIRKFREDITTIYKCDECDASIESRSEYYSIPPPVEDVISKALRFFKSYRHDPRSLKLGWTIKEEIGIVVINDRALSQINLKEGEENADNNG